MNLRELKTFLNNFPDDFEVELAASCLNIVKNNMLFGYVKLAKFDTDNITNEDVNVPVDKYITEQLWNHEP